MGRALLVEPLEERCLLDAGLANAVATPAAAGSPWQNPTLPLDVNGDGKVTPLDALDVINQLLNTGTGPLTGTPNGFFYDTNGDGKLSPLDALRVINAIEDPPQVTIGALTSFTPDVTPQVTVNASGGAGVLNGSQVMVDVDLNNNGTYTDPGESNRTLASLVNGAATFDLTPALPNSTNGPYTVHIRARDRRQRRRGDEPADQLANRHGGVQRAAGLRRYARPDVQLSARSRRPSIRSINSRFTTST